MWKDLLNKQFEDIEMKFVHTICYPDRAEIDVFERIIDGNKVLDIFSSFDFDTELKKPIEFYSPSIDFIRLEDKIRLIFSGIGKRKLQEFQVMYIIPPDAQFTNVFNQKNYFGSTEYTNVVSVPVALELLKCFINSEDGRILKLIGGIEVAAVNVKKAVTKIEPKRNIKLKIKKAKSDKSANPKNVLEHLITIVIKLLGIAVGLLFAFFAKELYLDVNQSSVGVYACSGFALFMFLVTYKAKIEFDDF
jgi:hypothetical protein